MDDATPEPAEHGRGNRQRYLKYRDKQREYYQANRQKKLKAVKAYTEANRDKVREYKRQYYVSNGSKVRLAAARQKHGADFTAIWAAMWEAQRGRCYLCGCTMEPDEAFLEHWHGCPRHESTKSCRYCRRGLAHSNCNLVVGHAADDPDLLRAIADNLERANAEVMERQRAAPQSITLF